MSIKIDWQDIAAKNGLSTEEFQMEVFEVAACLGQMMIDNSGDDIMVFTCNVSDREVKIVVTAEKGL